MKREQHNRANYYGDHKPEHPPNFVIQEAQNLFGVIQCSSDEIPGPLLLHPV
jgi:hypothetical protein